MPLFFYKTTTQINNFKQTINTKQFTTHYNSKKTRFTHKKPAKTPEIRHFLLFPNPEQGTTAHLHQTKSNIMYTLHK